MVNDFGTTRYCKDCGGEIVREGDCTTMYAGKKICKRTKDKSYCQNKQVLSKRSQLITNELVIL